MAHAEQQADEEVARAVTQIQQTGDAPLPSEIQSQPSLHAQHVHALRHASLVALEGNAASIRYGTISRHVSLLQWANCQCNITVYASNDEHALLVGLIIALQSNTKVHSELVALEKTLLHDICPVATVRERAAWQAKCNGWSSKSCKDALISALCSLHNAKFSTHGELHSICERLADEPGLLRLDERRRLQSLLYTLAQQPKQLPCTSEHLVLWAHHSMAQHCCHTDEYLRTAVSHALYAALYSLQHLERAPIATSDVAHAISALWHQPELDAVISRLFAQWRTSLVPHSPLLAMSFLTEVQHSHGKPVKKEDAAICRLEAREPCSVCQSGSVQMFSDVEHGAFYVYGDSTNNCCNGSMVSSGTETPTDEDKSIVKTASYAFSLCNGSDHTQTYRHSDLTWEADNIAQLAHATVRSETLWTQRMLCILCVRTLRRAPAHISKALLETILDDFQSISKDCLFDIHPSSSMRDHEIVACRTLLVDFIAQLYHILAACNLGAFANEATAHSPSAADGSSAKFPICDIVHFLNEPVYTCVASIASTASQLHPLALGGSARILTLHADLDGSIVNSTTVELLKSHIAGFRLPRDHTRQVFKSSFSKVQLLMERLRSQRAGNANVSSEGRALAVVCSEVASILYLWHLGSPTKAKRQGAFFASWRLS